MLVGHTRTGEPGSTKDRVNRAPIDAHLNKKDNHLINCGLDLSRRNENSEVRFIEIRDTDAPTTMGITME